MTKKLWPEDVAAHMNAVLGADIVTPPTSFLRTKKGISYFRFDCGHEQKMEAVREILEQAKIHKSYLVDAYRDNSVKSNQGILCLHIPETLAEQVSITIAAHAEKIKKVLRQEVVEQKPMAREPQRPHTPGYEDFYGSSYKAEPTYVPEITALIGDKLNKGADLLTLPGDLFCWFMPPQNPDGVMFSITDEGQLDVASGAERDKLLEEYKDIVRQREDLLTKGDRVFDPAKGQIVELPAGTVYKKLTLRDYTGMSAATYWNIATQTHHIVSEADLKKMKNIPRTTPVPVAPVPR